MKKYVLVLLSLIMMYKVGVSQTTMLNGIAISPASTDLMLRVNSTNAVNRLTIVNAAGTNQGYVGIGATTSPSILERLHVFGNVRASVSGTGTGNFISDGGIFNVNSATLPLIFQLNSVEKIRILTSGDVGIGITPAQKLHVNGGNVLVSGGYVSASGNLITTAGVLNTNSSNPLLFQTNGTERVRILSTSGFMSIGNITPTEMLHVNGNAKVVGSITGGTNIVLDNATPILYTGTGASELNRFLRISNSSGTSTPSGIKAGGVLVSDDYNYASPAKNDLIIKGKVGIGTAFNGTNANGYILAVNGKIGTKDVQIEATANPWPDYVFTSGHKLPSLFELEMYILANKHLPEVPTAKEVNENGYSVSELDAILLKKVEELTLYLIEQQKQINALRAELEKK